MDWAGLDNISGIDYEWLIAREAVVDVRQRPFVFSVCPTELFISSCCHSLRHVARYIMMRDYPIYRIRVNFRGMKISLSRKQTGFLRLYFRGSQVHRGKVARVMYCYKSCIRR